MSQTETQLESSTVKHSWSQLQNMREPVFGGVPTHMPQTGSIPSYSDANASNPIVRRIERRLLELDIPPHIRGFSYILEAVKMLLENEEKIYGVTKILYPDVAKLFDTTSTRVERAIRHAIEISWSREGSLAKAMFPTREGKPTNAEFLAFLSRVISMELYS